MNRHNPFAHQIPATATQPEAPRIQTTPKRTATAAGSPPDLTRQLFDSMFAVCPLAGTMTADEAYQRFQQHCIDTSSPWRRAWPTWVAAQSPTPTSELCPQASVNIPVTFRTSLNSAWTRRINRSRK